MSPTGAMVRAGRRAERRCVEVPHWVTLMPRLSDGAYRMYAVLLASTDRPDGGGPESLVLEMGRDPREAESFLEELEEAGIISRQADADSRPVYFVHEVPPPVGGTEHSASRSRRSASGNIRERTYGEKTPPPDGKMPDNDLQKAVEELCGRLADLVKANGAKRPKITYSWHNAARELLTEDNYTFDQVWEGIQWAQDDTFWASRTITMARLRKHFDQIIVQARKRTKDTSTPQGKQAQQDVVRRRLTKLSQFMETFEREYGRQMTDAEQKKIMERLKDEVR